MPTETTQLMVLWLFLTTKPDWDKSVVFGKKPLQHPDTQQILANRLNIPLPKIQKAVSILGDPMLRDHFNTVAAQFHTWADGSDDYTPDFCPSTPDTILKLQTSVLSESPLRVVAAQTS